MKNSQAEPKFSIQKIKLQHLVFTFATPCILFWFNCELIIDNPKIYAPHCTWWVASANAYCSQTHIAPSHLPTIVCRTGPFFGCPKSSQPRVWQTFALSNVCIWLWLLLLLCLTGLRLKWTASAPPVAVQLTHRKLILDNYAHRFANNTSSIGLSKWNLKKESTTHHHIIFLAVFFLFAGNLDLILAWRYFFASLCSFLAGVLVFPPPT